MLGRLLPLFGSDSFLNDLSEAGLPRMTSTALRWTPKRYPFTCSQHPTHQNNPTNGSKVRRGSIFSSSALPHFQPIRCTKWRFNLPSEGVNTFCRQTNGQKCDYLDTNSNLLGFSFLQYIPLYLFPLRQAELTLHGLYPQAINSADVANLISVPSSFSA